MEELGPSGGACLDCKRRYGDEYGFPDLWVPDEVWEAVNPESNGAGLLCPSCLCERAHRAGVYKSPASFKSGPFMDLLEEMRKLEETLMAIHYTLTAANKSLTGRTNAEQEVVGIVEDALPWMYK